MRIELVDPTEGTETWQIRMQRPGGELSQPLTTSIKLWTSTKRVVELLTRMYKAAHIVAPCGTTIHPKPPTEYPTLHPSQPTEPSRRPRH